MTKVFEGDSLTEQELKIEAIVDKIKAADSTLECIKVMERELDVLKSDPIRVELTAFCKWRKQYRLSTPFTKDSKIIDQYLSER